MVADHYDTFRKFMNIQALMCVALMSMLSSVETQSRSLSLIVTSQQVTKL